jgi:FkbM family methyltransferase
MKEGTKLLMRGRTHDFIAAYEVMKLRHYAAPDSVTPENISTIVDCGANVGFSCLWFARAYPRARILAFEPHPDHVRTAQANITLNRLDDRVEIRPFAVATKAATAYLTDQGIASQVRDENAPGTIPITSVDFFANLGEDRIDLLKLDIEGSEYALLADDRFSRLNITWLVVEWHATTSHPESSGRLWCLDRLATLGYDCVGETDIHIWAKRRRVVNRSEC